VAATSRLERVAADTHGRVGAIDVARDHDRGRGEDGCAGPVDDLYRLVPLDDSAPMASSAATTRARAGSPPPISMRIACSIPTGSTIHRWPNAERYGSRSGSSGAPHPI
jgi:hypothetical protein